MDCSIFKFRQVHCLRVKNSITGYLCIFMSDHSTAYQSYGFAVSLTVLAMKSRSHADYVISHAFQL